MIHKDAQLLSLDCLGVNVGYDKEAVVSWEIYHYSIECEKCGDTIEIDSTYHLSDADCLSNASNKGWSLLIAPRISLKIYCDLCSRKFIKS